MGFVLRHNFHLYSSSLQRECVMGMSARTDSLVSLLCLLQIIVFMCYGIMLNKWVLQTYQPDFMKSPLVYHPGHRAQVWRFFSYMFMHVGYESPQQFRQDPAGCCSSWDRQISYVVIWILFSFRALSSVWSSWGLMLYCSWWSAFLWRWSMASYE